MHLDDELIKTKISISILIYILEYTSIFYSQELEGLKIDMVCTRI